LEFFKNKEQVAKSTGLFGERVVDMLYRAHLDALWILENIGVRCQNKAIIELFQKLEADGKAILYDNRIYLTQDLVTECLATVPGINEFFVPQGCFFIGGRAAFLWDDQKDCGGVLPQSEHMVKIAKICAQNAIISGMGPGIKMADEVSQIDIMAEHCDKPIYFPVASEKAFYKAVELRKSRRSLMVFFNLTHHPLCTIDQTSVFFVKTVQAGVPIIISALPMAGISAPYSYNGVLSITHAEVLFGICVAQLINPGCTCIHGGLPSIADPRFAYTPNYGLKSHFVLNLLMAHLNMMLDMPTIQSTGTTNEERVTQKALEDAMIGLALCKKYGFHMMRHCFGFLRGMVDFSIAKLEKVIKITEKVTAEDAPEIQIPDYDDQVLEAIQRSGMGMYRDDPMTTANIGRIFVE
jgi:trimethylamine--corrinoid protein Co-methyltransferase